MSVLIGMSMSPSNLHIVTGDVINHKMTTSQINYTEISPIPGLIAVIFVFVYIDKVLYADLYNISNIMIMSITPDNILTMLLFGLFM